MFVIQPLAGRMKHDCMIVNSTVKRVYDQLAAERPFQEIVDEFVPKAVVEMRSDREEEGAGEHGGRFALGSLSDFSSDEERARFDLYRVLSALKDRQICDYGFEELHSLLPPGELIAGTTQVMPMRLVREVCEFLRDGVRADEAARAAADGAATNGKAPEAAPDSLARFFFAYPSPKEIGEGFFEPEFIMRRHLDQIEVYFVALDAAGNLEAVTAVQGLPLQPATLLVFLVAARRDDPAAFEDRVGIHLSRLFGLLQVTTLSAKVRFQYATGGNPASLRDERFGEVLADLGFRRGFLLSDELGPGNGLVGFDRTLF